MDDVSGGSVFAARHADAGLFGVYVLSTLPLDSATWNEIRRLNSTELWRLHENLQKSSGY